MNWIEKIWDFLTKISTIATIISFILGFFSGKKYEKSLKKNIKTPKKVANLFSNHNNTNQ